MGKCNSCGGSFTGAPRFCPSCGSPLKHEEAKAPEPEVLEKSGPPLRSNRRIGLIVFSTLLLFGLVFFVVYITPAVHPVIQTQPIVAEPYTYDSTAVEMTSIPFRQEGDDLVFSLDDLRQHRLVRFEYTGGKTPRNIMAYIAPDGRVVTSISLSEHCGSTEFTIKDNQIYCARCPSHWDMMTMEPYACCAQYYPDPIPSRVVGDEVHVAKEVVERWVGRL